MAYLAKIEKTADDWQSVLLTRYSTAWPAEARRVRKLQEERERDRKNWYAKHQERKNQITPTFKGRSSYNSHPSGWNESVAVTPVIGTPSAPTLDELGDGDQERILSIASNAPREIPEILQPSKIAEEPPERPGVETPPPTVSAPTSSLLPVEPEPESEPEPEPEPEPERKPMQLELELGPMELVPVKKKSRTRTTREKPESKIDLTPAKEGHRESRTIYAVVRNPKLREMAIRIHGRNCCACSFNFDEVYDPELAKGYIEIHHLNKIADGERFTDPATDLVPLCRNCHIMADKLALDLALRGIDPPGTIAELKRMLFPDPF